MKNIFMTLYCLSVAKMEIMTMGSGEIINGIEMITFGKIQTKD